MSAQAAAAASGCCCDPPGKPCTCSEYLNASSGDDFNTLSISGDVAMQITGHDCCGASIDGEAMYSGTLVRRTTGMGQERWINDRPVSCSNLLPIGAVIGSINSTSGNCAYTYECCNYTGCPTVQRTATEARLPWFWCWENETSVQYNACAGVVCQCDEGGIPCGGNCPADVFEATRTAPPETLYIALRASIVVCGFGSVIGGSAVRIEGAVVLSQTYDRCRSCGLVGTLLLMPRVGFSLIWQKRCRFPGDTVRGEYIWSEALNGGPPTQVNTYTQDCPSYIRPGGTLKYTHSIVASPRIYVA